MDLTTNSRSAPRRRSEKVIKPIPMPRDVKAWCPLQFAAWSGKVEMVTHLLTLPTVDPSIPDDRGRMPLDATKANRKEDIIQLLETRDLSSQTNCSDVTG